MRRWGDLIGEIITKSSSLWRVDGEGEGDSLCFPLLDGKGDLKVMGTAKGFGEGGTGSLEVEEDELAPNAGVANHVPGRFIAFVRVTRNALLDEDEGGSIVRCMTRIGSNQDDRD